MKITEFLLAGITEDENAARQVKPLGHNFNMGGQRQDEKFTHGRLSFASEDGYPRRGADSEAFVHFSRHDPARVLAECEAKRRIVEELGDYRDGLVWDSGTGSRAEWALLALALPYADHPDYQQEWRM